ncbi:MAG: Asp-tRNA(Asn)/Glu-tRNA(Gln) amidotransferase subunit GatC [Flavobacteriales bacterium]|nr:Asp-tRNA(Asn)/Glu-tRNA(Gln) amidotransferase subunit GatC [Flavobacteriales bacterium]MBT5699657.1 Asp-tRNA(Asn)/Glu-tRNA(Gln) amidotransferase subunit GatC [Flavobacteriales bacterium]MBT6964694.1 Asp-tRNA(Asn)/Glu-tRNA(Gln) amidotransferase subunit GatC [Flavobacteriales bacterium]
MEVNNKLIQDIAKLSKLKFDDSAEEKMKADLEKMLAFVDKLNEIDTEDVDPLIYMSEEVNVLIEDKVTEETSQKDALKNAPEKDSDYFKVPTVLKK